MPGKAAKVPSYEMLDCNDKRPSTFQIMALSDAEVEQIYLLKKEIENKNSEALKAARKLYDFDKKRCRAIKELDLWIKEIERQRK